MHLGSNTLLETAINSLNEDAAKERRCHIFDVNQQAVGTISKVSTNTVGNLQIKPNINGEADSQVLQPIKFSDSFEIELNKLPLPNQCGVGTLQDAIQRLCRENNIQTDGKIDTATFTSVVTALAGQHAEDDVECVSVTKAEFVPVFNSINDEKRVLALCYSLNGETKLRVDHIKVRGSMTCLGRQSCSSSALQAIEIPNLLATDLKENNPELFTQLQKNACLVAFVEYDLIQPEPIYCANSFTMFATRGGSVMRGDDRAMARGGLEDSFLSSNIGGDVFKGVSAYSVIGQGSQAQDHSFSIYECGERKLSNIHVFLVGAIVVNTNQQVLVPAQCENIASLMQERANELNNLYLPYKTYKFRNFTEEMATHVQKFNINLTNTDIVEHSILRLGLIDENPTECHINPSQLTPQYFFIDFGLPVASIYKLVANLQRLFGNEFCQYTPQFNQNYLQAIRFSLKLVSKNISSIKETIDQILAEPRNLRAYQKYSRQESSYNKVVNEFSKIIEDLGITTKTDCVEMVLLEMFSCEEKLSTARFQPGKTYVAKILDTHFFFDISEDAAKKLVDRINQTFPHQAHFISANTRLAAKGDKILSEISVENDLLLSQAFLFMFKETLNKLAENNPLLIEKLRIQSGTQTQSSQYYANKLASIALALKAQENSNQPEEDKVHSQQKLVEALQSFSTVIVSPQRTKSERCNASDMIRKATAFFESTQSYSENESFKKGSKKEIKEALRALGFRN